MNEDAQTVIGSIEVSNIPLFFADIIVTTLFLVGLSKLLGKLPLVGFTGSHSLVYYFFCGAIPSAVATLFDKAGFEYRHYWQVVAALIVVYSVSTAVAYCIYKYCPILVGKTKKREHTALF